MAELNFKNLHFSGITEGGIQTCVRVKPLQILFDIGRCPQAAVGFPRLLLTHGHLDHAAGLPYYISQRSMRNQTPPEIFLVPELVEPLTKILDIYSEIEGFQYPYKLIPVEPGVRYPLKEDMTFTATRSIHRVPSAGYTLFTMVKKLRDEFKNLPGREIARRKNAGEKLEEDREVPMVTFSGDTQIEFVRDNPHVGESRLLFLECTYIDSARTVEQTRKWGHIHLDEIIAHEDYFRNEQIVLMHFSKRYSSQYIQKTLKEKLPPSLQGRVVPFL